MTSQFLVAFWDDQPRWDAKIKDVLAMNEISGRRGTGPTGYALMRQLDAAAYCFGDDCAAECRKHGVRTVRMMDPRAYDHECQYFVRKFLAMRSALNKSDQVVLLDIDTVLRRPLPPDYWQRMASGAALQVPLQLHKRRKSSWRADKEARKYWVSAAYIYCRSTPIMDRLIDIMDEHADWWEETALGYMVDELMGGWRGPQAWIDEGYHSWGVHCRTSVTHDDDAPFAHVQLKCELDTGLRI